MWAHACSGWHAGVHAGAGGQAHTGTHRRVTAARPPQRLLYLVQVGIAVTPSQAAQPCPSPLHLELWQGDTLLAHSTLLLLPASLSAAAAELQALPQLFGGSQDVAAFLTDLECWLAQGSAAGLACARAGGGGSGCVGAWRVGTSLVRQAVLWGLPALSTMLVDALMAVPAVLSAPLTQLVCAPAAPAVGPAAAAHPGTGAPTPAPACASSPTTSLPFPDTALSMGDLGSLLHLALLSPAPGAMLAAAHAWGQEWGSREPGFAWPWEEAGPAGLTPRAILACLPADVQQLGLLLGAAAPARPGAAPEGKGRGTMRRLLGGGGSSSSSASAIESSKRVVLMLRRLPRCCQMVLASLLGYQELFVRSAGVAHLGSGGGGSGSSGSSRRSSGNSRGSATAEGEAMGSLVEAQLCPRPGGAGARNAFGGADGALARLSSGTASVQHKVRLQGEHQLVVASEAHFRRWVLAQSTPTLKVYALV